MRFLFIDDKGDWLSTMRLSLSSHSDIAYAECHNLAEAKQAIADYAPEVIFLDHSLSDRGNEGFEIADQITGIKIFSTTLNKLLKPNYQERGIEIIDKFDVKQFEAVIEEWAET